MTENEKKVLDYIRDRRNWRPPTWKKMVKATGVYGNKSLLGILKRLEEKGYLEKRGHYYYPKEWKDTFNIGATKRKENRR